MIPFLILAAVLLALSLLLTDLGWNNVLSPARNDVVFEGRNRAYGAYPLRRDHPRVMVLAFVGATGLFSMGVILPGLFAGNTTEITTPLPLHETEVTLDDGQKDPPSKTRFTTAPPVRPEDFPLVPIDSVTTDDRDTTSRQDPGVVGPTGPTGDTAIVADAGLGKSGGGGDGRPTRRDTIHTWVPYPPVFPGGEAGLMEFWGENIRFDPDDLGNKPQVTLYVQFVVDRNGEVTDAEVVNPFNLRLDRSLLNAVRRMPKWEPGRMDNEPVKVRLTQPVKFKVR